MKVRENNEKSKVDFTNLKPGDCFRAWGSLYVKSRKDQDATNLKNGEARVNMCGIYITPVNAEVQIID